MVDEFSQRNEDLLTGSYDCVDRIVLNAYYPPGHNPGGFRVWWRRWHDDSDEQPDNNHLMRLAGRFSRRVRGWARTNQVPVIDCKRGERKHRIAEDYLATHTVGTRVFVILVARAPVTVWQVRRPDRGNDAPPGEETTIHQPLFVSHHGSAVRTCDDQGCPGIRPAPRRSSSGGHEYVTCAAQAAGTAFVKEGNRFTAVADPAGLGQVADTLVAVRDRRAPEPGL
jgi:hypothetical protein